MELLDKSSIEQYGSKYIKRLTKHADFDDIVATRTSVTNFASNVGISYHPDIHWRLLPIMEQVKVMLPPANVLLLLVETYFQRQCTGFSFLHEASFKRDIERIIGVDFQLGGSKYSTFHLETKFDMAVIASLTIVLRLAYLSLINTFLEQLEADFLGLEVKDYLTANPIPLDIFQVSEQLLKEFDYSIDMNLSVLQALLLTFSYRFVAPELDTFSEETGASASFSRIVMMAKILGLDTDPDLQIRWGQEHEDGEHIVRFRRRFWHMLVLLDNECYIFSGSSLCIRLTDFEVSFASSEPQINFESQIERQCSAALKETWPIVSMIHEIIEEAGAIGSDTQLSKLIASLARLELLIEGSLGNLSDYLDRYSEDSKYAKGLKFRVLLTSKCFLLTIFFALYLFFENRGDLDSSILFCQKLHKVIALDLCCIQNGFLSRCDLFFGPGSMLNLRPVLFACNRCQMEQAKFRMRIICSLRNLGGMGDTATLRKILISIKQILIFQEDEAVQLVDALCKSHKSAWRIARGYHFGQYAVSTDKLYELNPDLTKQGCIHYPMNDLRALERLLMDGKHEFLVFKEMYEGEEVDTLKCDADLPIRTEDRTLKLMQLVQIDKMWQLLNMIKSHLSELDIKWKMSDLSEALSTINEGDLWEFEFDVLKKFGMDDMF